MSDEMTREAAIAYTNSVKWVDDGYHLCAKNLPETVYEKLKQAMGVTLCMGVHADRIGCDKGRTNLYTTHRQCLRNGIILTNVVKEST